MGRAPVGIFVFRRPEHTQRVIESLLRCPEAAESDLHLFADGARQADEEPAVEATRRVARNLLGDRATYHLSERNRGLSSSLVHGTNRLLSLHGRAIIVEDDLQLSSGFLRFMNAALDRYQDDAHVMQVSGFMFDAPDAAKRSSALFLPFTTSWGWATWERAWRHYDPEAHGWQQLRRNRDLRRAFDLGGACDYSGMLEAQMAGLRDSWAIRWYWSVFQAGGLTVYPPRSLVTNTGLDGTGTHGAGAIRRRFPLPAQECGDWALPTAQLDDTITRGVYKLIWQLNGGVVGREIDRVRRLVTRLRSWSGAGTLTAK